MVNGLSAWSYSRWADYDTCPLKCKLKHVDKLKEPPSPALENGIRVHSTLAAYMKGELPPNDPVPGWTYFADLYRQLRELKPIVEQQWGFDRAWKATGWFGNDTWFRSTLDVCVLYDDGDATVVDYKTGKPRLDDAEKQAELYALSIFKRYPFIHSVTVRFWFTDSAVQMDNDEREKVFEFAREQAAGLVAKWTARAEKMLSDTLMAPRPGQHCRWCAFGKSKQGPCIYG